MVRSAPDIVPGVMIVQHRAALYTFLGVMFGFKLWSILLIYLVADAEGMTTFLLGTHVLWFIVPVVLIWGPAMFWFRIVRVRRRKQKLLEAEWNVDHRPSARR